ncbi:MAG: glycosyltransferase family 4 protein [Ardenticatenaceae bacterium]
MRILYLSKALVVGAYQTKMEALAAEPGIELIAAIPPFWRDERGDMMLEVAHTDGYELRVIPMALNGWFHMHFYPTVGRLLDETRPDLFHIDEEAYNFATFYAGWLARRRGIPFLFFTWQNLLRRYPAPFYWIERWVFRHAAHAIAGNNEALRVLQNKGYRGPATIIPQFGVDLRHFGMKELHSNPNGPLVFGYAGRLVVEKGLHVLLEALGRLADEPAWRCEIRGSGPLRAALEEQARALGIADRVCLRPPLRSTEMPGFYQQIDVLVLPSLTRPNWKEQFGRVIIEAMASGNVVVGSRSGEIPHVIGDAGLLTPEGDAASLSQALRRLLADPALRHDLARAGRRRVQEHFTQVAIARRTAQVYRGVMRDA